jgi:hypothetical protein
VPGHRFVSFFWLLTAIFIFLRSLLMLLFRFYFFCYHTAMKKFALLQFLLPVLFLFLASNTAQAQFTVLPYTDKSLDACKIIVDNYQASGKIPSAGDSVTNQFNNEFNALSSEYDTAQKAYDDADKAYQKAQSDCTFAGQSTPEGQKICQEAEAKKEIKDQKEQTKNDLQTKKDQKFQEGLGKSTNVTTASDRDTLLGCAIKTGRISLAMVPYFITYIINFILGLVGLIAVLFTVIGGYYYVFGGLTEDKDKGKNTIKHALMGMGIAFLAWTIVNVILQVITG